MAFRVPEALVHCFFPKILEGKKSSLLPWWQLSSFVLQELLPFVLVLLPGDEKDLIRSQIPSSKALCLGTAWSAVDQHSGALMSSANHCSIDLSFLCARSESLSLSSPIPSDPR